PTYTSTLSLHDALPICSRVVWWLRTARCFLVLPPWSHPRGGLESRSVVRAVRIQTRLRASWAPAGIRQPPRPQYGPTRYARVARSEEHTSELQSRFDLV